MNVNASKLFLIGLIVLAFGYLIQSATTSGLGLGVVLSTLILGLDGDGSDDCGT